MAYAEMLAAGLFEVVRWWQWIALLAAIALIVFWVMYRRRQM